MNLDNVLAEILSSKLHQVRKDWYRARVEKEKGVKFFKESKNLEVSKMIDRLNGSLSFNHDDFSDNEDSFVVNQLSFDF